MRRTLKVRFGIGLVMVAIAAAGIKIAYFNDGKEEVTPPSVSSSCPEGQYKEEWVRSLLGSAPVDALDDRACMTVDEVTTLVAKELPGQRQRIDINNAKVDKARAAIEAYVQKRYQGISDPRRRLIQVIDDKCRSVESKEWSQKFFIYENSPLVGDVQAVAAKIMEVIDESYGVYVGVDDVGVGLPTFSYPSLPVGPNMPIYGKSGQVSLAQMLEDVYHEAWEKAYAGIPADYVYNLGQAVTARCGTYQHMQIRPPRITDVTPLPSIPSRIPPVETDGPN